MLVGLTQHLAHAGAELFDLVADALAGGAEAVPSITSSDEFDPNSCIVPNRYPAFDGDESLAVRNFGPVLFYVGLAIFAAVGLVIAGAIMGAVI